MKNLMIPLVLCVRRTLTGIHSFYHQRRNRTHRKRRPKASIKTGLKRLVNMRVLWVLPVVAPVSDRSIKISVEEN